MTMFPRVGVPEHNRVLCPFAPVGVGARVGGRGRGRGLIVIVARKKNAPKPGAVSGQKKAPGHVAPGRWERVSYSASCTLIARSAAAITVT